MDTTVKPEIEAILPLSYMQEGLLFHHLSKTWDQGYLNVECYLKGQLDQLIFAKAWEKAIERHAVLRTTVHWENLEKPLQIVHRKKSMKINFLDWSTNLPEEKEEKQNELKTTSRKKGADFEQGALLKLNLVKIEKNLFYLLWPSHHLLVDGWSSQIILNDTFFFYNAIKGEGVVNLDTLPTHKSYRNWIKNQDDSRAEDFWSSYFMDFRVASLFDSYSKQSDGIRPNVKKVKLSEKDTKALKELAGNFRVTLNTILQGAWSLLLSRYFDTIDIVYGTTVSGRSGDFPNIDLMAGMFANIQPVRSPIVNDMPFSEWFQDIQKKQQEARKYEQTSLDEITSFFDWPTAQPLFDSLLIFENYPKTVSELGSIQITDFKSGLTSNYPITLVVLPGKQIEFVLSVMLDSFDEHMLIWILEKLNIIIKNLIEDKVRSYSELVAVVEVFPKDFNNLKKPLKETSNRKYSAPHNEIESQLVNIWKEFFGIENIGIYDNFFDLGGKSILAFRMFALINKLFKTKLPATTLLRHPDIFSISKLIENKDDTGVSFRNLVPFRTEGKKKPLFCVHAGGGHVFFYMPLTKYIDPDRPVYGIQASGVDAIKKMHQDVKEMATEYIQEMISIQKEGPYNILVYCFSATLGHEMSFQMQKLGLVCNLIVADTMAEPWTLNTPGRLKMRLRGLAIRMINEPLITFSTLINNFSRIIRIKWVNLFGSEEEKSLEALSANIRRVDYEYEWKPHRGQISLILTQKPHGSFNQETTDSWKKYALGGIKKIVYSEGKHHLIFEESNIKSIAQKIEECCL